MRVLSYIVLATLIPLTFSNALSLEDSTHYNASSYIGITVGGDLTSLSGNAPDDAEYAGNTGFLIGMSGEFNITNDITIQFQPLYNSKSSRLLFDVGEVEMQDSMRLNFGYLKIPISAKFYSKSGSTYFLSGLDLGFLLNSEAYTLENPEEKVDLTDKLNSFDVAVLFGFGVNFNLGNNLIFLELRYEQSILNLSDSSDVDKNNYYPDRFRFGGLQLLTGFNFSI
jgi:hypothetical protein